jgi:hypothetical protein
MGIDLRAIDHDLGNGWSANELGPQLKMSSPSTPQQ